MDKFEKLRTLAERATPGYVLSPDSEQANWDYICACDPATILSLLDTAAALRTALDAMLRHSCVADSAPEDKDAEDHEAERMARAALAKVPQIKDGG